MADEEIQDEKETPTTAADFEHETSSAADDAREAESKAGGRETTRAASEPTTEETPAAEAPELVSIREVAKQGGFDPEMWKDDKSAAGDIFEGYKKYRQIESDYELYNRMKPQFNAWLAGQGAPQQASAQQNQEAPKWFQPPEFKQEWLNDLELGDDGSIKPKAGRQVSPEKLNKVANYIQWRRDVQEKFLSNPQEAIREMVSGHVEQESRRIAEEHVEKLRLQNEAQTWADRNANWLFRLNGQGQKVVDPITNRPVLTPEGQQFGKYFQQAEQMGMSRMQDMVDYAMVHLKHDLLQAHYEKNPGEKPPEGKAVVTEALKKASRSPKRAASQANPNDPGKSAQNSKADLGSQLMAALKDAGITELD